MENVKILEKVLSSLGETGSLVVSEYTLWFIFSSLGWIAFSLMGIFILSKWKITEECYDYQPNLAKAVKFGSMFVFGLIICSYLPDLFSPKAAAIHQLLIDIL